MTKMEQTARPAGSGPGRPTGLHLANKVTSRTNVVSIASARPHLELVPPAARRRHLGRKGRQALARRRTLDGAFLTMAMGAVALLWWSSF